MGCIGTHPSGSGNKKGDREGTEGRGEEGRGGGEREYSHEHHRNRLILFFMYLLVVP